LLRVDYRWRIASTSASILHRQVKRSGAGLVLQLGITEGSEKKSHRRSAPRSHSAVQRSRAIHVLQMDVRSPAQQATDRLYWLLLISFVTSDEAIRRVMQRAAFAMILCRVRIGVGASKVGQSQHDNPPRQMQRGIPDVNPMQDV
jgi:hypothetical protein